MENSKTLHNSIYAIMPYFEDDFIVFEGGNKRNYIIRFWQIGEFAKYKNILENNPFLKGYLKLLNSTAKREYSFPLNENGEVDFTQIDSLDLDKYQVNIGKEKDSHLYFEFRGNWELPLGYALNIVKQIVDKESFDVKFEKYNWEFDEIEEKLLPLLTNSNFYLSVSIETEVSMDYVIYIPLITTTEIPKELFSNIKYHYYNEDEFRVKLTDSDMDLDITKEHMFLELTSRYDENGNYRNVDSIDDVLKLVFQLI